MANYGFFFPVQIVPVKLKVKTKKCNAMLAGPTGHSTTTAEKNLHLSKISQNASLSGEGAGVDGKGGVEVAGDEVATRRGCNCDAVCCIKATLQIAN